MKLDQKHLLIVILSLAVCIAFACALFCYAVPMEDLSLDLSLFLPDDADPADFDDKGWTVFIQEGETVTLLDPDGFGGYTGLELGQTFYFSRLLDEELDDPTLQLSAVDQNFSVFLDGELIYTDCPSQDNRIGYLTLPMSDWERTENLTISLPTDYHGKVLTIAQSTPDWSETPTVRAYLCAVTLYCGYAYESSLIAEASQLSFACLALFLVGVLLMLAFVRFRNGGIFCLGLVAFLWMTYLLVDASFFYTYFGESWNQLTAMPRYLLAGVLLLALSLQAGKGKKPMLIWAAVYGVSLLAALYLQLRYGEFESGLLFFLATSLTEWIAAVGFLAVLVMGVLFWRKENSFYRLFMPLALVAELICLIYTAIAERDLPAQIALSIGSGQITYVYFRLLMPMLIAALITAVVEAARTEIKARMDKRLVQQQQELALASYESMRRQQEEVMMMRHDMLRHFHTLREMSSESRVTDYLTDLIGQNEKIRPVVRSGNEMLDIILNGRLSAAIDAGIKVEIVKAVAPSELPMTDKDLCALVMNIIDNAIKAASEPGVSNPYIRLDIHSKSGFFMFCCENAANIRDTAKKDEEKTVPRHGLVLKIIQTVAERYSGLTDTEYSQDHYRIRVGIPLI